MVELIITNISITHHIVTLVTLCDKGIKQSQSPRETDDSESNFQPCKGKPNSHAWNIQRLFRSNRLPFIPTRGSDPPQATAGPYAHPMCRTYACRATTRPYSWLPCNTYSHTSKRVIGKTKYEWWEVCPLLGPIGY
jgi:hypothetical protein